MASRSGALRHSIAASKRFLIDRIKRGCDILAEEIPDNFDDCQNAIDNVTEIHQLLESSVQKIEKKDSDWQTLIQTLDNDDEITEEQVQYELAATAAGTGYLNIIDEAQTILGRVATHLRKLNRALSKFSSDEPQNVASGGRASGSGCDFGARVRTPKLVLPSFDGDILRWKEFWSIFSTTIHDRADFTGVEKFSYLLPQLNGRAKQSIEGLLITDENYDAAIDILKKRFDRSDDRLVSMLYGELKQLPRSGMRREDKRRTFDTCERIFRQLKLTGEDIDSSRALTIDLLSKFPSGMVRDLQRHYNVSVHSKLTDVRDGIDRSISELESSSAILDDLDIISGSSGKSKSPPNPKGQSGYYRTYSDRSSSNDGPSENNNSAFSAVTGADGSSNRVALSAPSSNCYFCDGNHFNGDCSIYATARSREQRLYELKRCIKCGRRHNAGGKRSQCNNKDVKCVHCKTKNDHYSALCRIQYPSNFDNQSKPSQVFTHSPSSSTPDAGDHACVAVDKATDITILNNSTARSALFQTAKVAIINPDTGARGTVRICLDSLSNRSYVTEKVANLLGLSSQGHDRLLVSVFGSQKSIEVPTRLVKFGVIEADGSTRLIEANTTKIISNSGVLPKSWPADETKLLNSMKRSQVLADDPFDADKSVDVLIGADYVWEFITGRKVGTSTGIYFIPSTLGLMLAGQLKYDDDAGEVDSSSTMFCVTETLGRFTQELNLLTSSDETKLQPQYPDIDEYWNLETIGITDSPIENDDDMALNKFNETVYHDSGRYHVTWPWIEEKRCLLPSNYPVALRRFNSLSTRLKLNEGLLQGYRDVIATQLQRGIIEKVPADEINTTNSIHYLPHHPVVKSSSATTKIRIVFDASSKLRKHDVSLNDCLLRGPVILPDLCQLLMRFRIHKTVVISDIEKAFLQVSLQCSERDVTRFLWYDDDKKPDALNNIAVYRFCRVAFGIISSPFLLGATIQHHLSNEGSPFATSLRKDIYVDNVISGVDDESKLLDYYEKVKGIFNRAGMNLQEFCSNSKQLMDYIPACDKVKNNDVKVLGLKWDSERDDTIRILSPSKWEFTEKPTKRAVLQAVASVFDPLGFFQPILFRSKLFLQRLWQLELPWDVAMDDDLTSEWKEIVDSVLGIFDFRIPRRIGNLTRMSNIVAFSDASTKGYGVVLYLRCRSDSGEWVSSLIFAKSRLAPMQSRQNSRKNASYHVTLPRLELLGVTIAAAAAEFCRNAFGMQQLKIHFFIDSECVLHWIRSKQVLKRFVARRVEKIRCVENCIFHYVDTANNPADYLTRVKTSTELLQEPRWWNGPPWLTRDEANWPETRLESTSDAVLKQIAAEVKPATVCHTFAAPDAQSQTETKPDGLMDINASGFSSLRRLIRVTILCLKFLRSRVWDRLSLDSQHRCKVKYIFDRLSNTTKTVSQDVETATNMWVHHVQSTHFEDIKIAIRTKQRNAMISQLGLCIDDNDMVRTHSRFQNADLPDESKYPLLLPKNSKFTELIIKDVHQKLLHSGISHTLSEVRKRYWIPHGRSSVKKVLKRCTICKLFKTAVPFALPDMPPLPFERVSRSAPFQFTGLDYFGPVKIRINESTQKMWACLFTCLATRAVHLEAVPDCTSVEFLNSLIRFISRRGCPQKIISDNAAQFHLVKILGDRAWKRTPTDETIMSYSADSRIQWRFIIELAPWQGGHYERLVGVVKSVLKTAIGRRLLSWTDFVTLLTECEAIVNSRPITYIGDDVDSQMRVLRPTDFLIGRPSSIAANDNDFPVRDFGDSGKRLAAIWKQRKRQLDKLWLHWYDEYLATLRERSKMTHRNRRGTVTRTPREGEVILLHDRDLPRGSWRLARIVRLIPSADEKIRAAEIKLSNGVVLRRAVNFLIPLEIDNACQDANSEINHIEPSNDISDPNDAVGGEDEDFHGFAPEEVQRTVDAIQRLHHSDRLADATGTQPRQ